MQLINLHPRVAPLAVTCWPTSDLNALHQVLNLLNTHIPITEKEKQWYTKIVENTKSSNQKTEDVNMEEPMEEEHHKEEQNPLTTKDEQQIVDEKQGKESEED